MTNVSNASLELSHRLSDVATKAWEDGTMLQQVTPITVDLLNYWFGDARCEQHQAFRVQQIKYRWNGGN